MPVGEWSSVSGSGKARLTICPMVNPVHREIKGLQLEILRDFINYIWHRECQTQYLSNCESCAQRNKGTAAWDSPRFYQLYPECQTHYLSNCESCAQRNKGTAAWDKLYPASRMPAWLSGRQFLILNREIKGTAAWDSPQFPKLCPASRECWLSGRQFCILNREMKGGAAWDSLRLTKSI